MAQSQTSLESWVEKYLPLKVHHNLTELLEDIVEPDLRIRFREISKLMAATMRRDILQDQGYSHLKKKALALISALRIESNTLNDQKTAEREERRLRSKTLSSPRKSHQASVADSFPRHSVKVSPNKLDLYQVAQNPAFFISPRRTSESPAQSPPKQPVSIAVEQID